MTAPLYVIGAGGFGREVFSMLESSGNAGRPIAGFIDDAPSAADRERVEVLGSRILGGVAHLVNRTEPFAAVVAIGSAPARQAVVAALSGSPVTYPTVVHASATIGLGVELAEGVVLAPGCRLSTNIRLGRHVHVDQNAVVGHDTTVGDYARLNPQACVSGSVTIGSGALVGAGATVLQGLVVGNDAVVGAGAVVVRDVPPAVVVKGVPAR